MDRSLDSSSLTSLETMPSPDMKDHRPPPAVAPLEEAAVKSNQKSKDELNYQSFSSMTDSSTTMSSGTGLSINHVDIEGGAGGDNQVYILRIIYNY